MTLEQIRTAAQAGHVGWRYHALRRAQQRGITRAQALEVLQKGESVEEQRRAKPYPKCLMMAFLQPGKPLYVSVAYDDARHHLYVITVHWLDPRKWEDPWTRRPKGSILKRDKKDG